MSLLIYTETLSTRKNYIFQFLIGEILGLTFQCTDNEQVFLKSELPKFSYGRKRLINEIFIQEESLLTESYIQKQAINFYCFDGYKLPFSTTGDLPFDIFSAAFYLISRYEEYVSEEKDQYGRFHGKQSLAYQCGFLKRPVIDEWTYMFLKLLRERYPSLEYKKRKFNFQPTLDIDMPFYFRSESWNRKILKAIKLSLKLDFKFLFRDPFDVYTDVKKWDKKYGLQTRYFLLMGNKHQLDNPIHFNKKPFEKLISELDTESLGLHPSFQSNLDSSEIKKEKQALESIVGKVIKKSRQHYLMLNLPGTYRNLLDNGIEEDYTMAFADEPGFRAGTCTPFFWYDLGREEITALKIFPTVVMDQTLKRYQQLNAEQAKKEIFELIQNVKKVNGTFISLWHNESVGDFGQWKDWKNVYIEMLEFACKTENN